MGCPEGPQSISRCGTSITYTSRRTVCTSSGRTVCTKAAGPGAVVLRLLPEVGARSDEPNQKHLPGTPKKLYVSIENVLSV